MSVRKLDKALGEVSGGVSSYLDHLGLGHGRANSAHAAEASPPQPAAEEFPGACRPSIAGPVAFDEKMAPCDDTRMLGQIGDAMAGGFFTVGDFVLHHGGQVALDMAGFVPGVNIFTEGAQAAYHGMHAGYDHLKGNKESEHHEKAEAIEHGIMAGLNVVMGEGGEVVHAGEEARGGAKAVEHAVEEGAAREPKGVVQRVNEYGEHLRDRTQARLHVGEPGGIPKVVRAGAHMAHKAYDVGELGWDSAATFIQSVTGEAESLPFLGGVVPWMRQWAAGESDKKEGT
ncbi:MAG: hypothetical protein ACM31C_18455 [Acidobacteriota bacterium]